MPQRVLRAVLLKAAVDQRQFAVFVRFEVELGKGLIAAGGAVVAVTVGVHARSIKHKTNAIGGAFGREVVFAQAVAANEGFGANTRRPFAVSGEHLNDPASIAAVKRGCRAAQDFDALGGVEIKGRGLALAVRCAGGDAVGNQFDAAHAKRGAGTKATGRDLQVLRVVLPVLHHQAWNAGQHFRRVDAQLAITDLLLIDAVYRVGQVKTGAGAARTRDDTGVEFQSVGDAEGCEAQARQQKGKTGGYKKFHGGYRGSV